MASLDVGLYGDLWQHKSDLFSPPLHTLCQPLLWPSQAQIYANYPSLVSFSSLLDFLYPLSAHIYGLSLYG